MTKNKYAVVLALLLSACGNPDSFHDADLLDYGRAFYYVPEATFNHLFIDVESRMTLSGAAGDYEYLLLAQHPREKTWKNNGLVYSDIIASAEGASFITFLIDQENNSGVISRRFDYPFQPATAKQQCGPSPYEGSSRPPASVPTQRVKYVEGFEHILAAAEAAHRLVGVFKYTVNGTNVRVEFPVKVMNINPQPQGTRTLWQAASALVPLYVPGGDLCESLRNGYIAFNTIGAAEVSAVYLCDVTLPRDSQDYTCTVNYTGSIELYEIL